MKPFLPLLLLCLPLALAGCAGTPKAGGAGKAAKGQAAIAHPKTLRVRTTAYIGKRNAIGKPLSHGPVISAASDWSRFPLGTKFRVQQTGKTYVIDDYGSALVGTDTIDLCKPRASVMHAWGVRWVDIEILEWGSPRRSLEVLSPRTHVRYVRPMVAALRSQTEGVPREFHRVKN